VHGLYGTGTHQQEIEKALSLTIEEIDATANPQYIKDYQLKMTPTIIIVQDGTVRERFEGLVQPERLKETLKKYL
jgi:thioredoxin 1